MAFVTYNPSIHTLSSLASAIFIASSGATLVNGSVSVVHGATPGEASTISFFNGSPTALNIGAGLLLTPGGPRPPESNTMADYGFDSDPIDASDADLLATINAAYAEADGVRDVTYLQFQVNITDPALIGLRLDVVFGSEEYPFYAEDFPDVAGVYVNGVNYALFNNSLAQPLAVLNSTLGNFLDNTAGVLPIEYNGITGLLQVTAPVHLGVNTIKIGIADTGESDLDSGLFVSALQAVPYSGFGIATRVAVNGTGLVTDTGSNQVYLGNSAANQVLLVSGQDVVDGGLGVDEVSYTFGSGSVSAYSWNGARLTLNSGANASELVNVERVALADGGYYALDTGVTGNTYLTYALLQAGFNQSPTPSLLGQWVAVTDSEFAQGRNLGDVAQRMLDTYALGASNESIIGYLYQNIAGQTASAELVAQLASEVGAGRTYETLGDLFAYGALLSPNTNEIVGIVGSIQSLDASFFP